MKVLLQLPLGTNPPTIIFSVSHRGRATSPWESLPLGTECGLSHCCLPHASHHQPPNQRCSYVWLEDYSSSCAHFLTAREAGTWVADIFSIEWPTDPDLPGNNFKLQVPHHGTPSVPSQLGQLITLWGGWCNLASEVGRAWCFKIQEVQTLRGHKRMINANHIL